MSSTDKAAVAGCGLAAAIGTYYLQKSTGWGSALAVLGAGGIATASIKSDEAGYASRLTKYSMAALGGTLISSLVVAAALNGKGALEAFRVRNWLDLESNIGALTWKALCGSLGVTAARTAWALSGEEAWASERHYHLHYVADGEGVLLKCAALADGEHSKNLVLSKTMRNLIQGMMTDNGDRPDHYEEWLVGTIARHWDVYTSDERKVIVNGVLSGSWKVSGRSLYQAFVKRGQGEAIRSAIQEILHQGSDKPMQNYKKIGEALAGLEYDKFGETLSEIEKARAASDTSSSKEECRRWAKALQPLTVYHRVLMSHQFKQALTALEGGALLQGGEREVPQWEKDALAFRAQWNRAQEGKSLFSRYQQLAGQVYSAGENVDPEFKEYLKTLTPAMPDFGMTAPLVVVTDEEDGLMEAQMALYAPFRPKEPNFLQLKQYADSIDTLKRMDLVSEEAVKDKVLKKLPTDKDAAERKILRRLRKLASSNPATSVSASPSNDSPSEDAGPSEEAMEALAFSRLFEGEAGPRLFLTGLALGALSLALNASFFAGEVFKYPAVLAVGAGMGAWSGYKWSSEFVGPLDRVREGLTQLEGELEDPSIGTVRRWVEWTDGWFLPQNGLGGYNETFSAHATFFWSAFVLVTWKFRAGAARLFGPVGAYFSGQTLGFSVAMGLIRQVVGWNRQQEMDRAIREAGGAGNLWQQGWVRAGAILAMGNDWVTNHNGPVQQAELRVQQQLG